MRRSTTRRSTTALYGLAALLCTCLVLGACASDGGSAEAGSQTASKAPPSKGAAPPAGTPLAKIEMKMRPDEVRSIMGEPDSQHSYPGAIWKRFIPFYYGADSGNRVEYGYAGQGRVVFSVNAYSGQLNVVRVDYDPHETGR